MKQCWGEFTSSSEFLLWKDMGYNSQRLEKKLTDQRTQREKWKVEGEIFKGASFSCQLGVFKLIIVVNTQMFLKLA